MKLKKKQSYSVQEWIPISKIEDGIIYLSTGVKIYITEVEPINFKLKSNSEQIMILENYKKLLKSIDFDIQIIMVSKKTEVSKHLDTIIKNTKDNEKIKLISQDYINLIRDISAVRGSISRKFYIIFKHDNCRRKNTNDYRGIRQVW